MCKKSELAAAWSERTANDNSHGYSNTIRWGNSYDCSSFVISAYEAAGLPVRAAGASYTGDMKAAFLRCGFKDVTGQVNMNTGAGAIRGDVFLNENGRGVAGSTGHTVVYLGGGKVANCRSAEGTSDTADNSGNEIRVQSFWPYPWDCCLRLDEEEGKDLSTPVEPGAEAIHTAAPRLLPGNYPLLTVEYCDERREDTEAAQTLLCLRGFPVDITGKYDTATYNKVLFAQKCYGIKDDGECGPDTWRCLISNGRY